MAKALPKDKIEAIRQLATSVRRGLEEENGSESLENECLEASRKLKAKLREAGFEAIVIQGTYETDEPMDVGSHDLTTSQKMHPLHYWVEISRLVIDITSDQFNNYLVYDDKNEKVVVGELRDLPRYRVKRRDWADSEL